MWDNITSYCKKFGVASSKATLNNENYFINCCFSPLKFKNLKFKNCTSKVHRYSKLLLIPGLNVDEPS